MVNDYSQDLEELNSEKFELAQKYAECRRVFGTCKAELNVILACQMPEINKKKKNAGYETAILFLLESHPEVRETYKNMIKNQEEYKALEKLLEAYDSKIFSLQGIMKYNLHGERSYRESNESYS